MAIPGWSPVGLPFNMPSLNVPEDVRNPLGSLASSLKDIAEAQRQRRMDEETLRQHSMQRQMEEMRLAEARKQQERDEAIRQDIAQMQQGIMGQQAYRPDTMQVAPMSPLGISFDMEKAPTPAGMQKIGDEQLFQNLQDIALKRGDLGMFTSVQKNLEDRRVAQQQKQQQIDAAKEKQRNAMLFNFAKTPQALKTLAATNPQAVAGMGFDAASIAAIPDDAEELMTQTYADPVTGMHSVYYRNASGWHKGTSGLTTEEWNRRQQVQVAGQKSIVDYRQQQKQPTDWQSVPETPGYVFSVEHGVWGKPQATGGYEIVPDPRVVGAPPEPTGTPTTMYTDQTQPGALPARIGAGAPTKVAGQGNVLLPIPETSKDRHTRIRDEIAQANLERQASKDQAAIDGKNASSFEKSKTYELYKNAIQPMENAYAAERTIKEIEAKGPDGMAAGDMDRLRQADNELVRTAATLFESKTGVVREGEVISLLGNTTLGQMAYEAMRKMDFGRGSIDIMPPGMRNAIISAAKAAWKERKDNMKWALTHSGPSVVNRVVGDLREELRDLAPSSGETPQLGAPASGTAGIASVGIPSAGKRRFKLGADGSITEVK